MVVRDPSNDVVRAERSHSQSAMFVVFTMSENNGSTTPALATFLQVAERVDQE